MGLFEVKGQVYGFMGSSPAVGSDPKSEPFHDLMACCTRSSSHTVAACCGCTNIPHPAGGLRRPGPFFPSVVEASSHFGSATWIRQD